MDITKYCTIDMSKQRVLTLNINRGSQSVKT